MRVPPIETAGRLDRRPQRCPRALGFAKDKGRGSFVGRSDVWSLRMLSQQSPRRSGLRLRRRASRVVTLIGAVGHVGKGRGKKEIPKESRVGPREM